MGDSLPKGDLVDLFGPLPTYTPPSEPITTFPTFDDTTDGHPYHIVVVAAQECRSQSGVPRGIAAGVAKGITGQREKEKLKERSQSIRINRDKDKDKDKDNRPFIDKEKFKETHKDGAGLPVVVEDMDAESETVSVRTMDGESERGTDREQGQEKGATPHHGHHLIHINPGARGWSDILEDYFCNGTQHHQQSRNRTTSKPDLSSRETSLGLATLPSIVEDGGQPTTYGSLPTVLAHVDPTNSPHQHSPLVQEPFTSSVDRPIQQPTPHQATANDNESFDNNTTPQSKDLVKIDPQLPTTASPQFMAERPLTDSPGPGTAARSTSSSQTPLLPTSSDHNLGGPVPPKDTFGGIATVPIPTTSPSIRRGSSPVVSNSDLSSQGSFARPLLSIDTRQPSSTVTRTINEEALSTADISPLRHPPIPPPKPPIRYRASFPASAEWPRVNKEPSEIDTPVDTTIMRRRGSGPYQFLVKERLMGMYLAIFVHRDCQDWVEGLDYDYVPTGVIGGRVGNKGGIGMSLKMAGHRFLFVNAHLAAHTHRLHARLANIEKIKSELRLDCFLPEDDPVANAEDITDRFDTTFWMGDLNFRLEVSRLHADWLISQRDYAQALEFDQLKKVMREGLTLQGFNEAPIDFPPTFKYDVWRSVKHTRSIRKDKGKDKKEKGALAGLPDVREDIASESVVSEDMTDDDTIFPDDSRVSIDSSIGALSLAGSKDKDDPDYHQPVTVPQPIRPLAAVARTSAIKAKTKFMKAFRNSPLHSPFESRSPIVSDSPSPNQSTEGTSSPNKAADDTQKSSIHRQLSSKLKRRLSGRAGYVGDSPESSSDEEDTREGVYDSSSKQRVPSWCDRVLWNTHIVYDEPQLPNVPSDTGESTFSRLGAALATKLHHRRHRKDERRLSSDAGSGRSSSPRRKAAPQLRKHDISPRPASDYSGLERTASLGTTSTTTDTVPSAVSASSASPVPPSIMLSSPTSPNLPGNSPLGSTSPRGTVGQRQSSDKFLSSSRIQSAVLDKLPRSKTLSVVDYAQHPPHVEKIPDSIELSFNAARRWLHQFHRSSFDEPAEPTEPPPPPPPPKHHKGEVVCLQYKTIDDAGMRRIEGRS